MTFEERERVGGSGKPETEREMVGREPGLA
jgi:hypothetical protein